MVAVHMSVPRSMLYTRSVIFPSSTICPALALEVVFHCTNGSGRMAVLHSLLATCVISMMATLTIKVDGFFGEVNVSLYGVASIELNLRCIVVE